MRLWQGLLALTLVGGLLLAVGIAPRPALAAEVTACTPTGLKDAINAAGSDGTVTFDCHGTATNTDNVIDFADGDQITISTAITIDGSNGGTQVILDGHHATNFFLVDPDGDLTIRHMTLQHGGNDKVYEGGAIDVDSNDDSYGTLTVIGVTFFDNHSDQFGGAIESSGPLTITQSTFTNNQSLDGGAIWSRVSLFVSQSSFTNNKAPVKGGAITMGGTSTISQSSFTNNLALDGGAVALDEYLGTESTQIVASTFSGNKAPGQGSVIRITATAKSTTIAWSTIVQPAGTSPALWLDKDLTLKGVILGGEGMHCEFDGGNETLTNSYTLSNGTSCGLSGAGSKMLPYDGGLSNLGLGPLSTTTVNGVEQSYYPPIAAPALDSGSVGCDTAAQEGPDVDQIGTPRPVNTACDIGAIEVPNNPPRMTSVSPSPTLVGINQAVAVQLGATDEDSESLTFSVGCNNGDTSTTPPVTSSTGSFSATSSCSYTQPGFYFISASATDDHDAQSASLTAASAVQVVVPTTLCANQWNGSLSVGETCSRDETMIVLPQDGPQTICVNSWNGAASLGDTCGRSERTLTVVGDNSIGVCINGWNGAMRVSESCSRSERQELL